jgi:hypothetical protein
VSESKFKAGDRVVALRTNSNDNANGIKDGSVGTVRELTTDHDNLYNVVFDGIEPTEGVPNERNGAWVMYEHQLEIAPAVAADPVAEAATAYQRALCAKRDAEAERSRIDEQLDAANKVVRDARRRLNFTGHELDRVNHEAAGLKWPKPIGYDELAKEFAAK